MGIEEQIDRLIDLGEDIKGRLDLLVELASDHFVGASKMVADEPAKEAEPEHPAGPKPEPGEGYRILSKDPPEELQFGDQFRDRDGLWVLSINARKRHHQSHGFWYRRKIEQDEPLEPEYREPVLPADAGKRCEFSISGKTWHTLELVGWNDAPKGWPWKSRLLNNDITCWKLCRIKKDA